MSDKWFYIQSNERIGPIDKSEVEQRFKNGILMGDSYVWKPGMENWTLLKDVQDFSQLFLEIKPLVNQQIKKVFDWNTINESSPIFYLKIGTDRGMPERILEKWFSWEDIKRFVKENRINEKTLIMSLEMDEFIPLGDCPLREKIFSNSTENMPIERRKYERCPVMARIFFESDHKFSEGVCVNLSKGGIKILLKDFSGIVGSTISMNIHRDNPAMSFGAKGEVVAISEDRTGVSVKFKELSQESLSTIENLMKNQ